MFWNIVVIKSLAASDPFAQNMLKFIYIKFQSEKNCDFLIFGPQQSWKMPVKSYKDCLMLVKYILLLKVSTFPTEQTCQTYGPGAKSGPRG